MGVYHLMGLGRSPGVVTGPLSYLDFRYNRWHQSDQEFFELSGEASHRDAGQKVGDVQAIVFFSTEEILTGKLSCFDYIENEPGQSRGKCIKGGEDDVKTVLKRVLKKIWPKISGNRQKGTLFWCTVDRRNVMEVYEKIIRVVAALAGVGGQGKEMWANLTGGNNVTNLALQLAATLSGNISRLYYVQAQDDNAEKCLYYTTDKDYWIDIPVMPLAFHPVNEWVLSSLDERSELSLKKLYSRLKRERYDLAKDIRDDKDFENRYLTPLWKQGLISGDRSCYVVGPRWRMVKPYADLLDQVRKCKLSLEQLSKSENWIENDEIDF